MNRFFSTKKAIMLFMFWSFCFYVDASPHSTRDSVLLNVAHQTSEHTILSEICGNDPDIDNLNGSERIACGLKITFVSYEKPTSCELSDGRITIATITNNFVEYSIDGGTNWQSSLSFTSLKEGVYHPAVRYTNGSCLTLGDKISLIVGGRPLISSVEVSEPGCGNNNGTITILPKEGTADLYQYSAVPSGFFGSIWQSSNVFDNLEPGSYVPMIRNKDGSCETILNFENRGHNIPGEDTKVKLGNLTNIAPSANITTNVPKWQQGNKLQNLDRITDGNKRTVGSLDYQVHPKNADERYIKFTFNNYYSNGLFKFYNRTGNCCKNRISGSKVYFLKDGIPTNQVTYTINTGDDEILIEPEDDIEFDEVVIVFNGDEQNFREIEIYAQFCSTKTGDTAINIAPTSEKSTNITSWQQGNTLDNLNRMTDGNKNTGGVFDYQVHPKNARGKYIEFSFYNYYDNGRFVFYNRTGCCKDRITGSTVQFLRNEVVKESIEINSQDEVITVVPSSPGVFDKVKIIFANDNDDKENQNFREIEIFGEYFLDKKLNIAPFATTTSDIIHWQDGQDTESNLEKMIDGNKDTYSNLDYQVHPFNAEGKYISFTFNKNYKEGELVFYNRTGCCKDRITGSTVQFIQDGVKKEEIEITSQEDEITIVPSSDAVFNEVKIIFDEKYQNFREIEIFGKVHSTKRASASNTDAAHQALLEQKISAGDFIVAPNPNNGRFRVAFTQEDYGVLNIYDINSTLIKVIDVPEDTRSLDIDLREHRAGLYVIQFINQEGETVTKKVIKN